MTQAPASMTHSCWLSNVLSPENAVPLRYGRQVPFAFLESVKDEFRDKYGEKARTAQAGSLDRAFGWEAMHTLVVRGLMHGVRLPRI